MNIVKVLSKKEFKENLFKMGASEELITKAAVIEGAYEKYLSNADINIGPKGEIIIETPKTTLGFYSILEDGTAEYNTELYKIEIDATGMETRRTDDMTETVVYRENGKIFCATYLDEELSKYRVFEYEDNGNSRLDDIEYFAGTLKLENTDIPGNLYGNMGYLITNYPETQNWFTQNGFLLEEPSRRIEVLRRAIETYVCDLKAKLNQKTNQENNVISLEVIDTAKRLNIEQEIAEMEEILKTDGIITISKTRYSKEASEKNRLAYFENQIKKQTEMKEKQDRIMTILRNFVLEEEHNSEEISEEIKQKFANFFKYAGQTSSEQEKAKLPENPLDQKYTEFTTLKGEIQYKEEIIKEMRKDILDTSVERISKGKKVETNIIKKLCTYFEQNTSKTQEDLSSPSDR